MAEVDDLEDVPDSILFDPVVIHGWFEFWRCRTVAAMSTCRTRMKYINMILKKLYMKSTSPKEKEKIALSREMLKNYAQWFKRRIDMSEFRIDNQLSLGIWITVTLVV
jgi:hypothetical protein